MWNRRHPTDRSIRLALAASACAALLILAGCTDEGADTAASTTGPPTTTVATTPATTPATTTTTLPATTTTTEPPIQWDYSPSEAAPVVTLIDAGAEPREVRVYSLSEGAVAETSMGLTISQVQTIDGVTTADTEVQVDFGLRVEAVGVVPEGFELISTYGDYRVNASDTETEANLELSLGALTSGLSQLQLMAPNGRILAIASGDQSEGLVEMTRAYASSVIPLPAEAIGVGASWEAVNTIDVMGMELIQTSVVTLVEVDGSSLVVDVTTTQQPGPGDLALPGLETAEEVLLESEASGQAIWDLSRPAPLSASTEATQLLEVSFTNAGTKSRLVQETTTRMEMPSAVVGLGEAVPDEYVLLFELNEGDCYNDTEYPLRVLLVPCRESHDFEAYAVLTSPEPPGARPPDADQISSAAIRTCGPELDRVDPNRLAGLGWGAVAFPLPTFWEQGQRSYVCALWAEDSTSLTGSQLQVHTQFDDLTQEEFTAGASVSFGDAASFGLLAPVGSAHVENEALVLTTFAEHAARGVPFEQERPQRGAAWYPEPVSVQQGFTTAFAFQFEMYSWFTVGDGLAFVVQGGDTTAIGGGIGYDGMPNSVAVEFDTLREDWLGDRANNVPNAPDLLGNHIAVHTRGTSPNATHADAALGMTNLQGFYMADRAPHVALIVYEPGEMRIYVDDFRSPALIVELDLADLIDLSDGKAHVGFTASSGPTITGHRVLRWEFEEGAS